VPGCGNGHLDDGEDCDDENTDDADGCKADCTFTCIASTNCDVDGNVCNGVDYCLLPDHVCVEGTPRACTDDGSPCTEDPPCDPIEGCRHPLIDMTATDCVGRPAPRTDRDDTNPDIPSS
jgi:cysteine-rich repeat protein